MNAAQAPWQELAAQLRPFLARRVHASDVDDVLQDVFLRVQRALPGLRDEERFTSWLFQIARNSVAEHLRSRALHPVADATGDVTAAASTDEGPAPLACCVSPFVSRLPAPYDEAVRLVELDGLTVREAAAKVGISVSGMKSRVQRGRAQLRDLFEECCDITFDVRGKAIDYIRRAPPCRRCK